MIENIINTIALLVLCLAVLLYINQHMDRHTAGCERWGFVLTAAGAFGHACAYWWPWDGGDEVETIMHIGLALVAIAMVRGDLRAMIARAQSWDGIDRRGERRESTT
ncbi:MAG: hypothetical protein ING75_17150 [Rhodocyclaceae bacterium]|nr:hypothetical protein [Rhodocyclaceae bacterium]